MDKRKKKEKEQKGHSYHFYAIDLLLQMFIGLHVGQELIPPNKMKKMSNLKYIPILKNHFKTFWCFSL